MTHAHDANRRITAEVTSWPGVSAGPGSRGEHAFTVGRRQLGHLHGHSVFPGKAGPAARRIETEDDLRDVVALLRLNYERVVARHGVPAAA
jgi:hypothetical protein